MMNLDHSHAASAAERPPAILLGQRDQPTAAPALTPLATEARAAIPTDEAARHLGRAVQTMRLWACRENGPIRPIRVHGRLLWPVAELRRLLGVEAA